MLLELLVSILLLTGSTLMLFAALGLTRFGDVSCRAHALSKASTFGICLLLLALWIALDDDVSKLKLVLVLGFNLLTIPVASHLVALLMFRQWQEHSRREPAKDPPPDHQAQG